MNDDLVSSSATELKPANPVAEVATGFGAGLFDEDITDIDRQVVEPSAQEAQVEQPDLDQTMADVPHVVTDEAAEDADFEVVPDDTEIDHGETAVAETVESKPAPPKKRGHWDLIASVLGLGSRDKSPEETQETEQDAAESSVDPDATTIAPVNVNDDFMGLETIEAPEADSPLPDLFPASNSSDFDDFGDDGDDLIGWNPPTQVEDETEEVVNEVAEEETAEEVVDEDFVEFEVEELTPSARRSESRPRRRRKTTKETEREEEPESRGRRRKKRDDDIDDDRKERPKRRRPKRSRNRDREDELEEIEEDVSLDGDEFEDLEVEEKPKRKRRRRRGRREETVDTEDAPADEFDDDLEDDYDRPKPSSRRSRGRRRGRDSEDREDSRQRPKFENVPTWDETISDMIENNIKNHDSNPGRKQGGRRGGGRRKRN